MKVITRYVAMAYLRMLGLCMGAFIAIFLVVDFLEKIGRFTRAGADMRYIGLFFALRIPEIICQTSAMAVLMATLLTFGVLSMGSELTAMRGCGLSLGRIALPIFAVALLVSVVNIAINEFILPECIAKGQYIRDVLIEKKNPNIYFRQQNIWHRDDNYILKARVYEPTTGYLKGITLWKMGADLQPEKRLDAAQGELHAEGWLLRDAVIRSFSGGDVAETTIHPVVAVPLHLRAADLKVVGKFSDNMGIRELISYCDKLKRGGYDPTRYVAQMHGRISLSFAPMVMAFIAVPFAARGGRFSGIALGISTSLGIGFVYFIINSVVLSYGQAGALPPLVSAWAANVIFVLIGAWFAMRAEN